MGHGELGAGPLFNGAGVIRSIQHLRVVNRIPYGPEQFWQHTKGAPLHPWSMYTEKGSPLFGTGTKLARHYKWKALGMFVSFGIFARSLVFLFMASGAKAKTMTRKWKEAEVDSYYPFQQFPDAYIPADISRDPKADCWRIVDRVCLRDSLVITAGSNMRKIGFANLAKVKDN
jgi:hypothetical protein